MKFSGGGFGFVVLILPLVFLCGCASSTPEAHRAAAVEREVVGSGSADDRAAIDKTNQQMFGAEHGSTSDSSAGLNSESTNLP